MYSLDPVSGLRDRVEVYNIPSELSVQIDRMVDVLISFAEFNGDFKHEHPAIVGDNLAEIEEFARVRY